MKNASANPNKPVELNWVKGCTSHELNSCKLVELSSTHVKYGRLTRALDPGTRPKMKELETRLNCVNFFIPHRVRFTSASSM